MKSPFPYFGGKSSIASTVWARFGKVDTYIESFFGSGAVMFANPHWKSCVETVNDADHFIANAFRAIKHAPDETADWADNPVNETDLHARHVWLVNDGLARIQKCASDPDFYDAKVAGWWLWGIACWIGGEWCSGKGPWTASALAGNGRDETTGVTRRLPHLGGGRGVNRKLPQLGNAGAGVNRKRPQLGNAGAGVNRKRPQVDGNDGGMYPRNLGLVEYFRQIAIRLADVRVCCGDWSRICGPAVHWAGEEGTQQCVSGIFLDPPYGASTSRDPSIYRKDCGLVAADVNAWCITNGSNPNMRIALCGFEGEHINLEAEGWSAFAWKTAGGMSRYGNNKTGKENRDKERILFSPHCVAEMQTALNL